MEKRYYSRCMYGNYIQSNFKASGSVLKKSGTSHCFGRKSALVVISMLLVLIFGVSSCRTHQPTVIEKEKIVYQTKDSIVYKDSTVYVPYEVVKDYSLDTLVMKTSLAISKSWVDTSTLYIVGELKNLKAFEVKYVEKEKLVVRDTTIYEEKPVPYPVETVKTKIPTLFWITFFICIGLLVYVGVRLYLKFKPI